MDISKGSSNKKRKAKKSPNQPIIRKDIPRRQSKKVRKIYTELTESSDEDFDRGRTPSGNILKNVSDIRPFFSPNQQQKLKKKNMSDDQVLKGSQASNMFNGSAHSTENLKGASSQPENQNKSTVMSGELSDDGSVSNVKVQQHYLPNTASEVSQANHHLDQTKDSELPTTSEANDESSEDSTSEDATMIKRLRGSDLSSPEPEVLKQIAMCMQTKEDLGNKKGQQQQRLSQSEAMETENEMQDEMPKAITLELVWSMFSDLKKEMSRNKIDNLQALQDFKIMCVEGAAEAANTVVEHHRESAKKVKEDVKHLKNQNIILTGICQSQKEEICELSQKVEMLELNSSKKMAIMSGYELPQNPDFSKEDNIKRLEKVIRESMDINVNIDDYFHIGSNKPRPIVMEFQSAKEKRLVLSLKQNLKDFKSKAGRKIFINDYVPISIQEKRRRERKIRTDLEANLDPNDQEASTGIEYTKAGMTIAGIPYKKKVTTPSPKDLLDLDPEQLKKIMSIPTTKGDAVTKEGSKFVCYVTSATNHQQVRNTYMKMKLLQPNARHVVCAFSLKGQPVYLNKDFNDDGEPGSGRCLLELLEKNNIENVAIFAVRFYGGIKLGGDRFNCYLQAARNALKLPEPNDQLTQNINQSRYPPRSNQQRYNNRRGGRYIGMSSRPRGAPYTSAKPAPYGRPVSSLNTSPQLTSHRSRYDEYSRSFQNSLQHTHGASRAPLQMYNELQNQNGEEWKGSQDGSFYQNG